MNFITANIKRNIKLQAFIGFAIIVFFYRIILPGDSLPLIILKEVLVIGSAAFLILYFIDTLKDKTINPLSLVMSVGIVAAIIFFLISFSNTLIYGLFDDVNERVNNPDLVFGTITFIYAFIILIGLSHIFWAFKKFFF